MLRRLRNSGTRHHHRHHRHHRRHSHRHRRRHRSCRRRRRFTSIQSCSKFACFQTFGLVLLLHMVFSPAITLLAFAILLFISFVIMPKYTNSVTFSITL